MSYGYGEQPENPSVHELSQRGKKNQQIGNNDTNWRDNTNRGFDTDSVFKFISKSRKVNSNSNTISVPKELQGITVKEAVEMGLSDEEWKRQDTIRAAKRQQYLSSKGLL
jgi:hypothetical protein